MSTIFHVFKHGIDFDLPVVTHKRLPGMVLAKTNEGVNCKISAAYSGIFSPG